MKYKMTMYSMEHCLMDSVLKTIILNDAELKTSYRDPKDGRTVYDCKHRPRDMSKAFIFWELVE